MFEKIVIISRNKNYKTGNLLDWELIVIDISRQANTKILQQINYEGKLEEDNGATMFFIAGKQQKTILNFFLDILNPTE